MREDSAEGALIHWLRTGRIAVDRAGRLAHLRDALRRRDPTGLNTEGDTYGAWFTISYNVRQTKRYLASSDPLYAATVDVRLLYGLHEVFVHYFRVRHIPWRGDKEALRYLMDHDPAYLLLFQQCLAETDRNHKVRLYERLAGMTLAPVGPLWQEGDISVQFRPGTDVGPSLIDRALHFVDDLLVNHDGTGDNFTTWTADINE